MQYAPWQLNLFLGPTYYLYFRSLTNQEFRLLPRAWWHLLPGLALVVGAAGYDLGWLGVLRGQWLAPASRLGTSALVALASGRQVLAYLQYVLLPLYCWLTLTDYQRYRRYLDDNFSNIERLRFSGLRQLLLVQVVVMVLSGIFELLDWHGELGSGASWSYFFLRGLLIYWLIGVGLQANYAAATTPLRFDTAATPPTLPNLVPEPPAALPPALPPALPAPAASVAQALAPELLGWRDKLLVLIAEEQPWLEPELTLTELAKRLRTTPGLLSKVINAGCNQNFNDFVNAYRVREAQRLLADPRYAHYSLVGVALESGFNSRSTFNRVFKKVVVGHPPSELARPAL